MDLEQEKEARDKMESEALALAIAALLLIDLSVVEGGRATGDAIDLARVNLERARTVGWEFVAENAATEEAGRAVIERNDSHDWASESAALMALSSAEIAEAARRGADNMEERAIVQNVLADRRKTRASTYAVDAVVGAVERAKFVAMAALGYIFTVEKTWRNAQDLRVRKSHIAAHGQTVLVAEKFTVGGYEMMYPKDRSAPLSETANCRCMVEYSKPWSKYKK